MNGTFLRATLGDEPTCFAKPSNACESLLWATENNKTMCLVPSPPAFISADEAKRCAGLGLGCPGAWSEWTANGYDPTGKTSKLGSCYCDKAAGECATGTIAAVYAKCGCGDEPLEAP